MSKEALNIDDEATEYSGYENKNSKLELDVINALNKNNFKIQNIRNVYAAVYGFLYEMNKKKEKKLRIFNFLYKWSFKDAFSQSMKKIIKNS